MKNEDIRHSIYTPVCKGNYPFCLLEIAGQRIEWQYMRESTMSPIDTGLFMAMTNNKILQDQKY